MIHTTTPVARDAHDCTICVGTYGAEKWVALARERALPSARRQDVRVVHAHAESLHEARNLALEQVTTRDVVFLDADDELADGYIAMLGAAGGDIRVPAVQYVAPGGRRHAPYVPRVAGHRHDCEAACLSDGNWIVIGAMAPARLVRDVGGFEAFTWSEDWALWARCWKAGATIERVPAAVYVAHVNPQSRNRAPERAEKDRAHWEIHRAVWPELYEEVA